ncbi:MAG: hypothetical protein ACREIU_03750, partial [Planctomycetota bacterium]
HLPFVHPRTLGRAEVVEIGARRVVADLRYPIVGRLRGRSRFRQEFVPPDRVEVEVVGGLGRGTRYTAQFVPSGDGTLVRETLDVPCFLGWMAGLARAPILARIREVWREDLAVKMCRGGTPGIEAAGIAPGEIVARDGTPPLGS